MNPKEVVKVYRLLSEVDYQRYLALREHQQKQAGQDTTNPDIERLEKKQPPEDEKLSQNAVIQKGKVRHIL